MVEKEKKNNSSVLWIILVVGVVLAIILIFYGLSINSDITGNVIAEKTSNSQDTSTQKNCYDKQVAYEKQIETIEYYTETIPYIDNVCKTEDIPYNIVNFVLNYNTCNEKKKDCESCWYGACNCISYCIDKSISCSLDLTNLDNAEQGSWTMKFIFYDLETGNSIEEKEVSLFLYPQTTQKFTGVTRIQSTTPEGNANKNLSCNYNRIKLAQKTICEEVTKYREVQREKVVTKPTTEYRIEKICE